MPSSRGSSQCRDWTRVSYVSCIGRWVLYCSCPLGSSEVLQKPSITTAFLPSSVFPSLLQRLTWRGYTPTPPKQPFRDSEVQDRKRCDTFPDEDSHRSSLAPHAVSNRIHRLWVPPWHRRRRRDCYYYYCCSNWCQFAITSTIKMPSLEKQQLNFF